MDKDILEHIAQGREKRIRELRACAESIMDMAEDIIGDEWLPIDWKITIEMRSNHAPEIIVKRSVTTEKIINSMR